MFESFSRRAKMVIAAAGADARRRGTPVVGVDSLIVVLLTEDQDPDAQALLGRSADAESTAPSSPLTEQFFPPDTALELLGTLDANLPRLAASGHAEAVPTSAELQRTIRAAKTLQESLQHSDVRPLHLLAVALREPCEASRVLKAARITEDKVMEALMRTHDEEIPPSAGTQ